MHEHHLTIPAWDWEYLRDGRKSFLVIKKPYPGIRYGDVLILTYPGQPDAPLVRSVVYAEAGIDYLPDHIGIQVTH